MEITWKIQRIDVGKSWDAVITLIESDREETFRIEQWMVQVLMRHFKATVPDAIASRTFVSKRPSGISALNLLAVQAWHVQNGTHYTPPTTKQVVAEIALAVSMRRPPVLFTVDMERLRACLSDFLGRPGWVNEFAGLVYELSEHTFHVSAVPPEVAGMPKKDDVYYLRLRGEKDKDRYFSFDPFSKDPITFKKPPPAAAES